MPLTAPFGILKQSARGLPVHELAGLPAPAPLVTAYTISLGTPDAMADAASKAASRTLAQGEAWRTRRSREDRRSPAGGARAELIVDANEAWTQQDLTDNLAACAAAGVTLIEQPLPDGQDDVLVRLPASNPDLRGRERAREALARRARNKYDAVNIKLDKTGGLTEALATAEEATRLGLSIMVGCMVATSLAMAPAMLVAQRARVVDLDGALLLARDRLYPIRYEGSRVHPPSRALWG